MAQRQDDHRLKCNPGLVIVDVRGPDEFRGPLGHVASASNLPVGELPNRLTEVNSLKDMPVILVCRASPPVPAPCHRSKVAQGWSKQMMRISNSMIAAAGAAVALVPSWVWAQAPSDPAKYGYGPHMMGWGGGWYGMIFGPLVMILVLAVVIAVAVLLVRWLGGPWQATTPHQSPPGRTPLDILKERFARGEIDKDEFEQRRRVLGD